MDAMLKAKMSTKMKVKESHAGIRMQIVRQDCPIADQLATILNASDGHQNTTGDFMHNIWRPIHQLKRLKDLWDKEETENSGFTSKHLAEQVRNIRKKNSLKDSDSQQLELEYKIKQRGDRLTPGDNNDNINIALITGHHIPQRIPPGEHEQRTISGEYEHGTTPGNEEQQSIPEDNHQGEDHSAEDLSEQENSEYIQLKDEIRENGGRIFRNTSGFTST